MKSEWQRVNLKTGEYTEMVVLDIEEPTVPTLFLEETEQCLDPDEKD